MSHAMALIPDTPPAPDAVRVLQAARARRVAERRVPVHHQVVAVKAAAPAPADPAPSPTPTAAPPPPPPPPPAPSGDPQQYAESLVGPVQFGCLQQLWDQESGWNTYATNPNSGAYGIPQALPGSKMASAGADWQTNPDTQIRWGLGYIHAIYGSPCAAWEQEQSQGWY